MKTDLTPAQIAQYQDEGWLIVEDFLPPDELAKLSDAVEAGVQAMGGSKVSGEHNEGIKDDPGSYYDKVFLQRVNIWRVNDDVKDFFLNPALGEMLCSLAGIDGIRIWHDQTLQKLAWGNPSAWHLDVPNWSFHSPDAISIWIALNDVNIQNGCMYFLPGSHKIADFDRKGSFSPDMDTLFDEYSEFREIEPVAIEMKAGSASFHNGLMAHAAGPNMTPRPRRAMTCAYMPDGATFNGIQNILSQEKFESMQIGDLHDDDEQTPLVWKQT